MYPRINIGVIGALAGLLGSGLDRHYMPGTDPTSFGPALKDTYDPMWKNQMSEDDLLENFMKSDVDSEKWDGHERIVLTKLGRNHATGSIGSRGRLPQAGRSTWDKFRITCRDTYTRVGFDRYIMEQTKSKKGAFAEVVATEMEGAYEDHKHARNRMMWGYGKGILCLVNGAVAASTTITVDAPGNIAGSAMGNRYINGDSNSGQYVSFINAAGVIQGSAVVTAISADGTQFTTDVAITCDDNCKVVLAQSPTQNSYDREPEGLLAGIDDGTYVSTYHQLSRTTYPALKSTVITAVGAFSLDAIQQGIDAQAIRTGKPIDFFLCEHGVRRAYLSLLELDRRYTGADLMSPDGGTKAVKNPNPKIGRGGKAITYGDLPMFAERDAPYSMLFGLNKESWIRYVLKEGEWDDQGGGVIKWIQDFDEWTAFYLQMDNWHCHKPNNNIRWEDIDTDALAVHSL